MAIATRLLCPIKTNGYNFGFDDRYLFPDTENQTQTDKENKMLAKIRLNIFNSNFMNELESNDFSMDLKIRMIEKYMPQNNLYVQLENGGLMNDWNFEMEQ